LRRLPSRRQIKNPFHEIDNYASIWLLKGGTPLRKPAPSRLQYRLLNAYSGFLSIPLHRRCAILHESLHPGCLDGGRREEWQAVGVAEYLETPRGGSPRDSRSLEDASRIQPSRRPRSLEEAALEEAFEEAALKEAAPFQQPICIIERFVERICF
jgi:hypothetical protein